MYMGSECLATFPVICFEVVLGEAESSSSLIWNTWASLYYTRDRRGRDAGVTFRKSMSLQFSNVWLIVNRHGKRSYDFMLFWDSF